MSHPRVGTAICFGIFRGNSRCLGGNVNSNERESARRIFSDEILGRDFEETPRASFLDLVSFDAAQPESALLLNHP